MASKRLYAFRTVIVFFTFFLLSGNTSCSNEKRKSVAAKTDKTSTASNMSQINYAAYKVYVSQIVKRNNGLLVNINSEMGKTLLTQLERSKVTQQNVLLYDEKAHGYVEKYSVQQPFEYSFSQVSGFRIIGDLLTIDYSGLLSPNTRVAIYRSEKWYISVYKDNQRNVYTVIGSLDLTTWKQVKIECPSPILIFQRNGKVYALAGRQVWNVSEFESPVLIKELDESILKPDLPGRVGDAKDQDVIYSFNIDNYLVTHVYRIDEGSDSMLFITINLDDFSYKTANADGIKLGPYNYKAVNRSDGWKIYYIGRDPIDGIIVLDPLSKDGPVIVERLPGVNIPK